MNTITITFPEVKVNTEIKDLTFDSIEDMIFEISQHIARKVFEKAITDIDDYLRNKRERGKLKNTGKREKYFLTRFGDILYFRTRYQDKKTGKSCYLLDEALSIVKNQRLSLSRARIENFLSSLSSYREVVTQARLLLGNFRSHEAIRQSVIKEGSLIIENQKKKLKQIENLDYPDKEAPDAAYLEADATYISLQHKGKKEKEKLEVKLGVGYSGKEARYKTGKSKRLKEKFTFIGTGKDFMEKLSLIAEERLSLSKVKKVIFGGDGDSWITSGIKDYFSSATYILDLYHLYKKFKECLSKRKEEQKVIKNLLLSNQIDQGLSVIDQLIRNPYDLKEKDNLVKLYTYISRNRQGISNQFKLKEQEIGRAGAIESNVNKAIAARFKKRGMSWSKPGALALLKIKETILNNEWDDWWETERERNIKVDKYKPPLPASCFKKETESSPLIEVTIPAFIGPDQGKPWVGVLRKLTEVGYY
ncbi:MAG TPA: ISLre2 family transposase [Atribacterota bacterium]|nr:ISLre2 family transposase [Atribacterota bacterium]